MEKLVFIFFLLLLSAAKADEVNEKYCDSSAHHVYVCYSFQDGDELIGKGLVKRWSGHKAIYARDETTGLRALSISYKGGDVLKDNMYEHRYHLKEGVKHVWEYFKIVQPTNFWHREFLSFEYKGSADGWKVGDVVETESRHTAVVAKITQKRIFIKSFYQPYDINWGKGRKIVNLEAGSEVVAIKSRIHSSINKFSSMWQGKYANAGMLVGLQAYWKHKGGEPGVSYCIPSTQRSSTQGPSGLKKNFAQDGALASCFDPKDNGKVVHIIIERKRSSGPKSNDGIYKVWKRINYGSWNLIFSNERIIAFQPDKNYLDSGYIFGWSNSGFNEDTQFNILEWGLFSKNPIQASALSQ